MIDSNIVKFIKDCIPIKSQTNFVNILSTLLPQLTTKDRIYSLSRTIPSLNTDLVDFSLKNFTVNKTQLNNITHKISSYIAQQPDTFILKFIFSLLSHLKVTVISEIYRSFSTSEYENSMSEPFLNLEDVMGSKDFTSPFNPETLLKDITESDSKEVNKKNNSETYTKTRIDFISMLPIHISEQIINMLDEKSLQICSSLCTSWRDIVDQVRKECVVSNKLREQALLLQSMTTTPADPTFARDTDVRVPKLEPENNISNPNPNYNSLITDGDNHEDNLIYSKKQCTMDRAYKNVMTKNVIIEERNVFCGTYSVMMIMESLSKHKGAMRTISFNGGDLVAIGSNKAIQFLNAKRKPLELKKNRIHGHAGSIKVIRFIKKPRIVNYGKHSPETPIDPKEAEILSGSYDTTIRRWDTYSGKCLKIYMGHSSTITDLDATEEYFASGSLDCSCKLWRYDEKYCFATMRHNYSITSVAVSAKLCATGDVSGLVKIWNSQDGSLIKNLSGHQKEISSIKFDDFHILTSSLDCFALMWSAVGDFNQCIGSFRHPKPVFCMEFIYLRTITGCEDGKIRIWNVLNGQCVRIIRGNSRSDPILNLIAHGDIITINTISNVLVLHFAPIQWIYSSSMQNDLKSENKSVKISIGDKQNCCNKLIGNRHVDQRFERSRFAGKIDPRIFIPFTTNLQIPDSNTQQICETFQASRSFENGSPLTRSTAWIISPALMKPLNLSKDHTNTNQDISNLTQEEQSKLSAEASNNYLRREKKSNCERRFSYGFENQDHLESTADVNDIKQTLRKHIRSPPEVSAEAMPNFIKKMVTQMKLVATTGKSGSTLLCNHIIRPSSSPSMLDSKSKMTTVEIKSAIIPTFFDSTHLASLKNGLQISFKKPKIPNPLDKKVKTSYTTMTNPASSSHLNDQSANSSFSIPPDYRKILQQKKLEFDQRNNAKGNSFINNPSLLTPENSKQIREQLFLKNLNLQTYESSQQYLQQINKLNQDFESKKQMKAEEERHEKWLRKATESPNLKYEKDVIMKRPRSAKI